MSVDRAKKTKKTANEVTKADSTDVLTWMQKRKITSTQEVADRFGIRFNQATANIAILRIKGVIERSDTPEGSTDQSSRWVCV